MKGSHFSKDTQDFIHLLAEYSVKYVIVGGEAVIYYGFARLTGDVDFFYESSAENTALLYNVLNNFWDNDIPGDITKSDLMKTGMIIQFGIQPNRIDIINKIEGVSFEEAWLNKTITEIEIEGHFYPLYFIGLRELLKNKKSINRNKDLEDIKYLEPVLNKDKSIR